MVTDMLENLPPNEKKITHALRIIILETAPVLQEKLSYGVPYFFYKSRVCFIWPASIPNGGFSQGVSLGFCKGYLMANEEGLLQAGSRKQVLTIKYMSVSEISPILIRRWVHEAVIIDQLR